MFEQFFDPTAYREGNLLLSTPHITTLALFVLLIIWLFLHRRKAYMKHVRWVILGVLIFSEISIIFWSILMGLWDIRYNLPLQLCTISLYLSAYMIWRKSYPMFEIVYFFGCGGAFQALLTPELFYTYPHYRFFHFFIAHIAIILAILYMVFIYNYRVSIKSAIKSFIYLNIIAILAFGVNQVTGANYMFLARKPENVSIIDFLGPYPWYILSLEFIVIIMFLLLYLPFLFSKKQ